MSNFLIKVKVSAGAKNERLLQKSADSFVVSVREEAERGEANKRVTELVHEHFGAHSMVRLLRGQRSPSKIFSVVFRD